ncbi:MAG TPA: hypothetical protein VGN59_02820 [Acidimicrobiia bacterium]
MSYAFQVVECALLGIGLWLACAGIGARILPAAAGASGADRPAESPIASWRQPGIAACVGLAVLVVVGGLGVALHLPWWILVAPFLIAGLVLAVQDLRRFTLGRRWKRSTLIVGGIGIAAFVGVALAESAVGLRFVLNACDDLRAYLPMARRLLDTNAIIEPWSLRRLQGLGGFTFLQALPVAVFGNAGIGVAETTIAGVFLAGLFVANGFRSTWARIANVVFIVTVVLVWVPRTNTTAVLLACPLVVAVLAATVELRRALLAGARSDATRWAIAGGLVTAAVTSARTPLGVVAALVIAIGALSLRGPSIGERVRAIAIAAVATVVAIAPWSVALWQSVRTPFYPLVPGNVNPDGPAARHAPVHGLHQLVDRALDLLRASPYLWIAVGVLVLAIVVRRALPDAAFVVIAASVVVVVMIGFALTQSWEGRQAFVRYVAPMSQGLCVFFVYEAVRRADGRDRALDPTAAWPRVAAVAGSVALAFVAFSGLAIHVEFGFPPQGARLVENAVRDRLGPGAAVPASEGQAYERVLAGVTDPAHTILAVDRPYLVDYGDLDLKSLDVPGWAAPHGDFPFFEGPGSKIATLRRRGFDTLIATQPDRDVCLAGARPLGVPQKPAPYGRYDRYYRDWTDDLTAIEQRAPDAVRRVGDLVVVDLPRAERDLAGT